MSGGASVYAVGTMVAGSLLGMPGAVAHQSDESTHLVEIDPESGRVEQLLSVSAGDLAHHLGWVGHDEELKREQLEEGAAELESYMVRNVRVWADGEACRLESSRFVNLLGQDERVHLHVGSRCAKRPAAITLENRMMMEGPGGYRHMGRAQVGERVWPMVFDVSFPTFVVDLPVDDAAEGAEDAEISAEEGDASGEGGTMGWVVALVAAVVAVGVSFVGSRVHE